MFSATKFGASSRKKKPTSGRTKQPTTASAMRTKGPRCGVRVFSWPSKEFPSPRKDHTTPLRVGRGVSASLGIGEAGPGEPISWVESDGALEVIDGVPVTFGIAAAVQ